MRYTVKIISTGQIIHTSHLMSTCESVVKALALCGHSDLTIEELPLTEWMNSDIRAKVCDILVDLHEDCSCLSWYDGFSFIGVGNMDDDELLEELELFKGYFLITDDLMAEIQAQKEVHKMLIG